MQIVDCYIKVYVHLIQRFILRVTNTEYANMTYFLCFNVTELDTYIMFNSVLLIPIMEISFPFSM